MTRPSQPYLQSRRATAWFLLLVCAWMGSGGVLHHTEAALSGRAGSHGPSGLHRTLPTAPADACAACEWTQGLQGRPPTVARVATPLFTQRPRAQIAAASPTRRVARIGSPRAPPACLLFV